MTWKSSYSMLEQHVQQVETRAKAEAQRMQLTIEAAQAEAAFWGTAVVSARACSTPPIFPLSAA